jgi:ferrous iron transport protein A
MTASLLADLPDGTRATVAHLHEPSHGLESRHLQRLSELGFLPGEPVQVLRRGPGGREPLAVAVGDAMFALRLVEARHIAVVPV